MPQHFKCNCKFCGHTFDVSQGGGMAYLSYFCDGCGETKSLPRRAPRPDRAQHRIPPSLCKEFDYWKGRYGERAVIQTDGSLYISEIPRNLIQRFTVDFLADFLNQKERWVRSGDSWDEDEIRMMLEISGLCKCGGEWKHPEISNNILHPLHRCPKCKSKNFDYEVNFDILSD